MKTKSSFQLVAVIILILALVYSPTHSLAQSGSPTSTFIVTSLNDSGPGSLRKALLDANATPGAATITFYLSGAIHLASALSPISEPLDIDGLGQIITLSGEDQVRLFEIQPGVEVRLANLAFTDGWHAFGGAIYNRGSLRLENCRFSQNHANQGAAVFNENELLILNSQFEDNLADYGGGAIWNHSTATVEIHESVLQDNRAESDFGGGLFNYGTAIIDDTQISNNWAQNVGGGIINWGTLEITDSRVNDNYAKLGGGVDNTSRGTVVINNTWITANRSGHWGGGINNDGELSISWSQVLDNRGVEFGAGIYNSGRLTLSGTSVARNLGYSSPAYADPIVGGGIYNSKDMVISNSSVQSNQAFMGGGIYNSGNLTLQTYARVVENTSGEGGGAGIFNHGTLNASLCFIDQNVAHAINGGAIFNDTGAVANLTDCQVVDNETWMAGGGVYNLGEFSLLRSRLAQNLARDMGGGIFSLGPLTITDSSVDHNDSYNYAGGIYSLGGLTMTGSSVTHNRTWTGGGLLIGKTAHIENSTISSNLVGGYGGGIENYGTTEINHTTITANNDEGGYGTGSGINNQGILTISNSIVAGNIGADNCTGPFTLAGPNLSDDASCSGFSLGNPRLGPLQDNGGPTYTHALLARSLALDTAAAASCPLTDQRGQPRTQGLGCDLGSFEAYQLTLQIDINPKTTRNLIDLRSSGLVPVAILSTPAINVPQQVVKTSFSFGITGSEDSLFYIAQKPVCSAADINGDGLADLICHFKIMASSFTCQASRGILRAELNDGKLAVGSDVVKITPCP